MTVAAESAGLVDELMQGLPSGGVRDDLRADLIGRLGLPRRLPSSFPRCRDPVAVSCSRVCSSLCPPMIHLIDFNRPGEEALTRLHRLPDAVFKIPSGLLRDTPIVSVEFQAGTHALHSWSSSGRSPAPTWLSGSLESCMIEWDLIEKNFLQSRHLKGWGLAALRLAYR